MTDTTKQTNQSVVFKSDFSDFAIVDSDTAWVLIAGGNQEGFNRSAAVGNFNLKSATISQIGKRFQVTLEAKTGEKMTSKPAFRVVAKKLWLQCKVFKGCEGINIGKGGKTIKCF